MIDPADKVVRYLLNTLPESERVDEEERLLADEGFADLVKATEGELLDAYARGELGAELQARVETELLFNAVQLDKLEVAKALTAKRSGRRSRPWGYVLAIAASIVLAGGVAIEVKQNRHDRPPVSEKKPALGRPFELVREETFLLTPGMVRGSAEATSLRLQSGMTRVRFELELPSGTPGTPLTATLETERQQQIWAQNNLGPENGGLQVVLAVALLKPGNYVFRLNTVPSTQYYFQIRSPGK